MGHLFRLNHHSLTLAIMGGVIWLFVALLTMSVASAKHKTTSSITSNRTKSPSISAQLFLLDSATCATLVCQYILHLSSNKSYFLFYPFTPTEIHMRSQKSHRSTQPKASTKTQPENPNKNAAKNVNKGAFNDQHRRRSHNNPTQKHSTKSTQPSPNIHAKAAVAHTAPTPNTAKAAVAHNEHTLQTLLKISPKITSAKLSPQLRQIIILLRKTQLAKAQRKL